MFQEIESSALHVSRYETEENAMSLFAEFIMGLVLVVVIWLVLTKYVRSMRSRPVSLSVIPKTEDEAGKHCGPKILEEYALGLKILPDWVVVEIGRHLESCRKCRWQVADILQTNLP